MRGEKGEERNRVAESGRSSYLKMVCLRCTYISEFCEMLISECWSLLNTHVLVFIILFNDAISRSGHTDFICPS